MELILGTIFLPSLLMCCFDTTKGQSDIEKIEEFIQDVMEYNDVPGLSIAVVKDGEPFLENGYGVRNLDTLEPVDEHTLFFLASTTKHMTGALLVQQISRNNTFDLETPVKEILGDEFHLSDYYRTMNVNSRDLMAHRVNIPMSDAAILSGEVTDRSEHIRRSQYWEAVTQFRSNYRYTNTMTTAAGVVAGLLSPQQQYEEAMLENLFQPLGMLNTTFTHLLNHDQKESIATPYNTGYISGQTGNVSMQVYIQAEVDAPSGGCVSSASDLAKWLQFQVNNGRSSEGEIIVEEDVLEQTRSAHFMSDSSSKFNYRPFIPVNYAEETYGLGISLGSYRKYKLAQHSGSMYGYWTTVMMLPDEKMGIFILTNGPDINRASDAMMKIKLFTMDVLLEEEPWVNVSYPFNQLTNEQLEAIPMSESDAIQAKTLAIELQESNKLLADELYSKKSEEMTMFEGLYGNFALGNISIEYDNTSERLVGFYGVSGTFDLVLLNNVSPNEKVFLAYARDPWWWIPPIRAIFEIEEGSGLPLSVTVPAMLIDYPPTFYRDLNMADAPDPPRSC